MPIVVPTKKAIYRGEDQSRESVATVDPNGIGQTRVSAPEIRKSLPNHTL
jgi:hypothetical protein